MEISLTKKQWEFVKSTADETLFGGAAGGGKSYAQLIDALLYALRYRDSRQLILRRTFPELRRSLVTTSLSLYPKNLAQYTETHHRWSFLNGSTIEFGHCDSENDVRKYQSAEYDVIRFDELTHFTEFQFTYLLSRIRGTNGYPKMIKSSTNPGGPGHGWVKKRYIDIAPHGKLYTDAQGNTRIFIPARVQDNRFLMEKDPGYLKRLMQLDDSTKKALLYGRWDIFEGQFFPEFDPDTHVVKPFPVPKSWRRYLSVDYGLDMLAALWIAVDERGHAFVYREVYEPGHIISSAAERLKSAQQGEKIFQCLAPADLFSRRQETGRSVIDIFAEHGLYFDMSPNLRAPGWYSLREWLKPVFDEQGIKTARLKIFDCCVNLIRTLPALCYDEKDPSDCSITPHEITHAPDALRGFAASLTPADCACICRGTGEKEDGKSEIERFLRYGG